MGGISWAVLVRVTGRTVEGVQVFQRQPANNHTQRPVEAAREIEMIMEKGLDIVENLKKLERECPYEHRAIIHDAWNAIIWLRASREFWAKVCARAVEVAEAQK